MKYTYCGITFKSNIKFPFFYESGKEEFDYEIYYSETDFMSHYEAAKDTFAVQDQTYYLYFKDKGFYEITKEKMVCHFSDIQYMYATICNLPFSVIALLKKAVPFHASSIVIRDKGAIIFLGDKGIGKTTISSLLDDSGLCNAYGDDMVTCVNSFSRIMVNRGSKFMKVTGQTAKFLERNRLLDDVYYGLEKRYYLINTDDDIKENTALYKIFVLERGKNSEYKILPKSAACCVLIHNIVGVSLLEQFMTREIKAAIRMIENVNVYKLTVLDSIDKMYLNRESILKLICDGGL